MARVPRGVLFELQRFYYDTAWLAHAGALASLMKLVNVSQVLFGSDYPYRSGEDQIKGIVASATATRTCAPSAAITRCG